MVYHTLAALDEQLNFLALAVTGGGKGQGAGGDVGPQCLDHDSHPVVTKHFQG